MGLKAWLSQFKCPFTAFIITIFLYKLGTLWPNVVDIVYSQFVFPIFRLGYDYTLGWLPIPSVYILFVVGGTMLILVIRKLIRTKGKPWHKITSLSSTILKFVLWTLVCFYWFWGYNYTASTLEQKLSIQKQSITEDRLYEELDQVIKSLEETRAEISLDTMALSVSNVPHKFEEMIRGDLKNQLSTMGLNHPGRPRVRLLHPRGTLLHFSTAGIYFPFVFEGHVDAGLHPIVWPFTMSHEMTHGFGITDEGDCNFIAHLSCIQSADPFIRYSGWLGYARYVMSNARTLNQARYKSRIERMNRGIVNDLLEIYEYSDRYKEVLPVIRDLIYDSYLKTHGVSEGLASYHRIVDLKINWSKQLVLELDNQ